MIRTHRVWLVCGVALALAMVSEVNEVAAQASDVRTSPGNGELVLSFVPTDGAVGHDVYMAAEAGVTSANYTELEGGRAVLNVASPVTIRGLDNNRGYFFSVVERDAGGGALAAAEISGAPRGLWAATESGTQFRAVAADAQTVGLALAVGTAPGGCQVAPKPAGCDVYRSTDGGASWEIASMDIVDLDPRAVAVNSGVALVASKNIMVAGSKIYRSIDSGTTWASTNGVVDASTGKTFAFDPANPMTIFGGNFDFGRAINSQIVRSVDGGETWPHVADMVAPNALNAQAIAIDPASPSEAQTVWVGGPGTPRLARSVNGGNTWVEVVITVVGSVQDIVFDQLTPSKVWVADTDQVFESQNGGLLFTPVTAGFDVATQIRSLARDSEGGVLYVGTSTGVYESRDDGRNFAPIRLGLDTTVTDIAFVPDPPGLVAATPAGLYRLDMTPPGPVMPLADAGADGGGDPPGDGCGCTTSGGNGSGWLLLFIALAFVVRESVFPAARRLARRSRG